MVCLGNGGPSQAKVTVAFPPRAPELSKHLSTTLEVFEPAKGSWTRSGSIRVLPTMTFEAAVEANDWKVFRVSP